MMQITRKNRFLLSILSGILMVLSFPYTGSITPLVFISWIPLLIVESNVLKQKYRSSKVYIHALIAFFIYNLGSTWWIWNASSGGAILAIVLNALIMAFVFYLFHVSRKSFGITGYVLLPLFWIAFEFIHFHWELSWPWLNVGNVFSIIPSIVQWYSITGILGGTLWVLTVNLIGFFIVRNVYIHLKSWKEQSKLLLIFSLVFCLPIIVSLGIYFSYEEKIAPVEIVAIQPNIDPYNEKFNTDLKSQLDKIFIQGDKGCSTKTKFVLAPETAISATFYEEELTRLPFYEYVLTRKDNWKGVSFLTGASTLCFYEKKNSTASRKIDGGPGYIESYNTSLLIDHENNPHFVHKSKLVLGVEKIPFTTVLPWLEEMAINLDGASGSLGIEKEPKVLKDQGVTFAPSICYESIYGEFISQQVKKGAELIFVITNDGWWGDTPGYKQHASFSRLRAIENRRSLARSANTGISCFINQRGDVIQKTDWWKPTVIKGDLNKNNELTIYSKFGDVIGKLFAFISIIIIVYIGITKIQKIFSKKEK